jgi:hypothetical protein
VWVFQNGLDTNPILSKTYTRFVPVYEKFRLDGYIRMRENFVKPDPLEAVPKKLMELAIIAADVVQAHPWGAVRHTQRFVKDGGTVPELIEAVALVLRFINDVRVMLPP